MAPIVTAPDFSKHEAACDRPAWDNHRPQVPCLSPSGFRTKAQHLKIRMVLRRHFWRRAWGATGRGTLSDEAKLYGLRDAATKLAR
jgi:hypothetical protein